MKISVITVNYNNRAGLQDTLSSIFSQDFPELQSIVIDGGSTDGSVDVMKHFSSRIAYWVSERDDGIYHAMNKGIRQASGDYLIFLNSGDCFFGNDILRQIHGSTTFDADIIYGDLYFKNADGTLVRRNYPATLTLNWFVRGESLPHPATFIRKELFNRVGCYNERFRIAADWEFWVKAICLHSVAYKHVPIPFSVFDTSGISSHAESRALIRAEREMTYARYFPNIIEDYRKFLALEDLVYRSRTNRFLRRFGLLKI